MNKKILIAGTRLTGDELHIGTYYGWVYQIKRAQKDYNVIIMISDFQSLDNNYDSSYSLVAKKLKENLKKLLPNVPIIIESDIKDILKLGFLIQKSFKPRYYNRVMPIRKQIDNNGQISFHTLLYPSLMVADILALNAEVMFNKPEGLFQHSEVVNNVIDDLNKKYSFEYNKMSVFNKQHINILSLDSTGPMKRNRKEHGMIEIEGITEESVYNKLKNCSPEVIESIVTSIEYLYKKEDLKNAEFIKQLSKKIVDDIKPNYGESFLSEEEIIKNANKNVDYYIKKITNYEN